MFYLRVLLAVLWFTLTSVLGLIYALFFWGNLNIDRDYARVFSWGILKIFGIQVEVEGREHLEAAQPCIYIANHQSNLDMGTFGGIYPKQTVVIGKKELRWIPFFGLFFTAAGNVMIDRNKTTQALTGMSQAVDAIKSKQVSIWIFPEGTRNKAGKGLLPFKKGPFHMAMQADVPLVPLICSPLSHRVSWRERKIQGGVLKIRVLPPIFLKNYSGKSMETIASEVRDLMLKALTDLEKLTEN